MIKPLTKENADIAGHYPTKVIQFGEGNFLRAFADWCIDAMNANIGFDAGVAIVQPIERGMTSMLNDQDNLYHHLIRGLKNGKEVKENRLISCINEAIDPFKDAAAYFKHAHSEDLKLIISNTTEAGIQFDDTDLPEADQLAKTFPGKLTQLLKKRFDHFEGSAASGLVFIPCELIEKNGEALKKAILDYADLWSLGDAFKSWITTHNFFANTLVDRIVPGFPKDEIDEIRSELGYDDQLVVSSEVFHLWVIEGPKEVQDAFPADQAGLNVKFVADLVPYRTRKVRILNGAHTCMVPVGLLAGIPTVRESVEDKNVGAFIQAAIAEEIATTIELPQDELNAFSNEVIERFKNPFIRHELKSISLNSISKFKVRVLPTIKDFFEKNETLPKRLIFSFACLIKLYLWDEFSINDDQEVTDFFKELKAQNHTSNEITHNILSKSAFWGEDLNQIPGLTSLLVSYLDQLATKDLVEVLNDL